MTTIDWTYYPPQDLEPIGPIGPYWTAQMGDGVYTVHQRVADGGQSLYYGAMDAAPIGQGYTTRTAAMDACAHTAGRANVNHRTRYGPSGICACPSPAMTGPLRWAEVTQADDPGPVYNAGSDNNPDMAEEQWARISLLPEETRWLLFMHQLYPGVIEYLAAFDSLEEAQQEAQRVADRQTPEAGPRIRPPSWLPAGREESRQAGTASNAG